MLPTQAAVATLVLDSISHVWSGLGGSGLADERRAVARVALRTGAAAVHDALEGVRGGRCDLRVDHLGAGRRRAAAISLPSESVTRSIAFGWQ